jgi:hypothetical protein
MGIQRRQERREGRHDGRDDIIAQGVPNAVRVATMELQRHQNNFTEARLGISCPACSYASKRRATPFINITKLGMTTIERMLSV